MPPAPPQYPSSAVSLQDYFEARLRDLDVRYRDRHADQETRLQQRFDAQEKSVNTAMVAAEKAVNAALTASEKAVDKSERAQELRNEVANEFRSTIADNTAQMWSAKEGQGAVKALEEKTVEAMESMRRERSALFAGLDARITSLERMSATQVGRGEGHVQTITDRRASAGEVRAYIALAVTVAAFLIVYVLPGLAK